MLHLVGTITEVILPLAGDLPYAAFWSAHGLADRGQTPT